MKFDFKTYVNKFGNEFREKQPVRKIALNEEVKEL